MKALTNIAVMCVMLPVVISVFFLKAILECFKFFGIHVHEAWVYRHTGSGFVNKMWKDMVNETDLRA